MVLLLAEETVAMAGDVLSGVCRESPTLKSSDFVGASEVPSTFRDVSEGEAASLCEPFCSLVEEVASAWGASAVELLVINWHNVR